MTADLRAGIEALYRRFTSFSGETADHRAGFNSAIRQVLALLTAHPVQDDGLRAAVEAAIDPGPDPGIRSEFEYLRQDAEKVGGRSRWAMEFVQMLSALRHERAMHDTLVHTLRAALSEPRWNLTSEAADQAALDLQDLAEAMTVTVTEVLEDEGSEGLPLPELAARIVAAFNAHLEVEAGDALDENKHLRAENTRLLAGVSVSDTAAVEGVLLEFYPDWPRRARYVAGRLAARPSAHPSGMTLDDLQTQVMEWQHRELPGNDQPLVKAAKVAEEAGEVLGATLKATEPDRHDGVDWEARKREELGDVVLAACGVAGFDGLSLLDLAYARWATVSQRRYATAPRLTEGEKP